jgi:hypothetical protein
MKIRLLLLLVLIAFQSMVSAQQTLSNLEQTINKGKSENITTLISIAGGTLIVDDKTSDLATVKLTYDKKDWNPSIAFAELENSGKLTITAQTEGEEKHINDNNTCKIHLNPSMNYSLGLMLGAGLADINLQGFNIHKAVFRLGVGSFTVNLANTSIPLLKVEAGIGEASFDLSGTWKNNLSANINAGIGQMTLLVPSDVGVRVTVQGFLGNVETPGYAKEGKEYTNALYGKTKNHLDIEINGAIGTVIISEK